jgi:hypothetical protein
MKQPTSARTDAKDRLLGLFEGLIEEPGDDGIIGFAKHIGIQLSTYDKGDSWWPIFLAHYTTGKELDEARVGRDLESFPPIARRVAELKAKETPER